MSDETTFGVEIDRGYLAWVRSEGGQIVEHNFIKNPSPVAALEAFFETVETDGAPIVVALSHPSTRVMELEIDHSSDIDEYLRAAMLQKAGNAGTVNAADSAVVGVLDQTKTAQRSDDRRSGSFSAVRNAALRTVVTAVVDQERAHIDELLEVIAGAGADARVTLSPLLVRRDGLHAAIRFAGLELVHVVDGLPRESRVHLTSLDAVLREPRQAAAWASGVAEHIEKFSNRVALPRQGLDSSATGRVLLYGIGAGVRGLKDALDERGLESFEGLPTERVMLAQAIAERDGVSVAGWIATAAAAAVFEGDELAFFPNPYVVDRALAAARSRYRIAIGGVALLALATTGAVAYLPGHAASSELDAAKRQLVLAQNSENRVARGIAVYNYVKSTAAAMQAALSKEPNYAGMLRIIQNSVPATGKLSSVLLQPEGATVQVTVSLSMATVPALVRWEQKMQGDKKISNFFSASENVTPTGGVTTTVTWDQSITFYPRSTDSLSSSVTQRP
jgi:hypothetical protein